jgi:hypothetical protein
VVDDLLQGGHARLLESFRIEPYPECPNAHRIGKLYVSLCITDQKGISQIDGRIFLASSLNHAGSRFHARAAFMSGVRTVEDIQNVDAGCRKLREEFPGKGFVLLGRNESFVDEVLVAHNNDFEALGTYVL